MRWTPRKKVATGSWGRKEEEYRVQDLLLAYTYPSHLHTHARHPLRPFSVQLPPPPSSPLHPTPPSVYWLEQHALSPCLVYLHLLLSPSHSRRLHVAHSLSHRPSRTRHRGKRSPVASNSQIRPRPSLSVPSIRSHVLLLLLLCSCDGHES